MDPARILGSETEFGLLPHARLARDGTAAGEFARVVANQLFGSPCWYEGGEVITLTRRLNWWNENLFCSEASSSDDPSDESSNAARIRRMGLSGSRPENGSRMYLDAEHLEYSTPECRNPFELVAYERAGECMMRRFVKRIEEHAGISFDLLKRNWDYHDSSYACHENYLLGRKFFDRLVTSGLNPFSELWILHLVTRQIYTGAGRFDPGSPWPGCFSFSPRAAFITNVFSSNTMDWRPLINQRDRPYADHETWARLHVITGDSNRADWSNLLKYGTSALILLWLEDCFERGELSLEATRRIGIRKPARAMRSFSRIDEEVPLAQGVVTLHGAQEFFCDEIDNWLSRDPARSAALPWASDVVKRWRWVLKAMMSDPEALATKLDWCVKKSIFESRYGEGVSERVLQKLDYAYHVVGRKSFFAHLEARGYVEKLVSVAAIRRATLTPPPTRAAMRVAIQHAFAHALHAISWHAIAWGGERIKGVIQLPDPRTSYYVTDSEKTQKFLERLMKGGAV